MPFTLAHPIRLSSPSWQDGAVVRVGRGPVTDRDRLRARWRRSKHGYVLRVPQVVHSGISVNSLHLNSMISNTGCTALLVQGSPFAGATASPP